MYRFQLVWVMVSRVQVVLPHYSNGKQVSSSALDFSSLF